MPSVFFNKINFVIEKSKNGEKLLQKSIKNAIIIKIIKT